MSDVCEVCGLPIAVGDWPCVTTIRPHGKSVQTDPFKPYFDVGLGKEITSLGDRRAAMRGEIDDVSGERRNKLDYREKLAPGEISARQDRIRQQQRDARHE